tara:strand:- start:466 stop:1410 length:945 start_codon:yes stop_codon:yes gene_type:complete
MSKAKSFSAVAGGLIICFSSMLVADENKTETKNGSSKNPLSISPEMLPNLSPEMQLMLLLNTMPHKPEWIELRKKLEDMNDKAMKTPVKKYTYQSSTTPVTIGGRIDLPTIVMRPGAFTSVSFVDAYGNPWDILSAQPSNQLVTVIKDEDGAISHNMLLVINEDYVESDLALFLKGYPEPLLIKVQTGSEVIDREKTFKIMSAGPSNKTAEKLTAKHDVPVVSDDLLREFLVAAPDDARVVPVEGDGVDVYQYGDFFYVITEYQLSQAYTNIEYGEGKVVYKLSSEQMLDSLLFIDNGKLVNRDVMLGSLQAWH